MKIKEVVVNGILVFILTALLNTITSIFMAEQAIIRINNPVKISESEYQLSLNISNFSSTSLNGIRLTIPENIDIKKLKCSKVLAINKVESGENNSIFEIDRVGENKNIDIVIILNSLIKSDDIGIEKNNNRIKIEYSDKQKSPMMEMIVQLCITAFIYSLTFGIFFYRDSLKRERDKNEMEKQVNFLEKSMKDIQENAREVKIKTDNFEIKCKKNNLLLLSRLSEYKKELNFWKDTIRKMLYEKEDKTYKVEYLFKLVTKELKTYQTQSENIPDIDYLTILSEVIRDKEI